MYVACVRTEPSCAHRGFCTLGMNLLSGVTWKGAKLRLGEAKADFRERLTSITLHAVTEFKPSNGIDSLRSKKNSSVLQKKPRTHPLRSAAASHAASRAYALPTCRL